MSTYSGGETTFRIPAEDPAVAECTGITCELSSIVTEPGFVTAVVLLGLVAFLTFAYVRDAKECCREERRRVVDERDAFERFADRVASLEPTPTNRHTESLDGPMVRVRDGGGFDGPDDVRVRRVVDAYRETVMSLPHYRAEYDETVSESLAAEIGTDTTVSLASGGTLSPELQSALVSRSRQAASSRSTLVDAIDAELDALDDAEATLTEIDRGRQYLLEHLDEVPRGTRMDADIDVWRQLQRLETRCDEAVADRQARIRDPPLTPGFRSEDSSPTFYEYLYGPLTETTYPVLAQFSELAERIRADRAHLTKRIADAA